MGNTSTKESRSDDPARRHQRPSLMSGLEPITSSSADRPSSRRDRRVTRSDFGGILGLSAGGPSGSNAEQTPYERRETKQEREARRLERERVARIKERERSLKEEHVDGGYLVTLGTYTGVEDFNKQVVRQLQIERKLAPFWRGLNDLDDNWTEHQIIAAARGLPIPAADETPPDELVPQPFSETPAGSAQNLNNLMVPMGGRTLSTASDHSVSNAGSALPSPTSAGPARTSSPFKPRGKALAAVLGGSSRNASTTDITPREINLPNDPFVNGTFLEVFLYKDATECPICFLSYPPYLNHTRCCDQAICSECFVQIKRPDPHYPEGHNENDPNTNPEEAAGLLVSEPACCPYCTQPDFGVTYEPPPFRRGLTYAISHSAMGAMNTAMSSSSSLNSATLSPTLGSPGAPTGRRRAQSLSAHAPNVILTDRVRPEWSTKLQAARAHQARRAAAATALHTAAFLMGNTENRPFRVSRFSRRNTGTSSPTTGPANGTATNPPAEADGGNSGADTPSPTDPNAPGRAGFSRSVLIGPGAGQRRTRMEDLEDMMFMEAIRLSLAEEEERKRKADKEERKEAKKREKEERKAAKAAAKSGPYESGEGRSGHSSASGSTLSLPGFGRKRGNSAASNLRVEASVANAMANTAPSSPATESSGKGKGVDRGPATVPEEETRSDGTAQEPATASSSNASTTAPRPIPSPHQPAGPSHLRQMSSASSVSSSLPDSQAGSYQNPSHLHDPHASGLSLGVSDDGGEHDRDPSASTEPMFNFRSLAEVVGVTLEGEHAGRRLSRIEADKQADGSVDGSQATEVDKAADGPHVERVEHAAPVHDIVLQSNAELPKSTTLDDAQHDGGAEGTSSHLDTASHLTPPKVMVTPETPLPLDDGVQESKQLGYEGTTTVERVQHQVTQ